MGKAAGAFRTISEAAEVLGVQAHVIRFWETKFNQIKPVKRAGGRRYYRPDDVALLSGIRTLLHDEGMTIKGVQKMLREEGVATVIARAAAEPEGETLEGTAEHLDVSPAPVEGADAEPPADVRGAVVVEMPLRADAPIGHKPVPEQPSPIDDPATAEPEGQPEPVTGDAAAGAGDDIEADVETEEPAAADYTPEPGEERTHAADEEADGGVEPAAPVDDEAAEAAEAPTTGPDTAHGGATSAEAERSDEAPATPDGDDAANAPAPADGPDAMPPEAFDADEEEYAKASDHEDEEDPDPAPTGAADEDVDAEAAEDSQGTEAAPLGVPTVEAAEEPQGADAASLEVPTGEAQRPLLFATPRLETTAPTDEAGRFAAVLAALPPDPADDDAVPLPRPRLRRPHWRRFHEIDRAALRRLDGRMRDLRERMGG